MQSFQKLQIYGYNIFSRKSVVLRGETLASIFQHIYHRSTYTSCSCLKIAASSLQQI